MSSFEFVKSMDDVLENILYLEKVRRTKTGPDFERYKLLIKRGQSFVTYPISEGVGFAPTKFLNAKNNNFQLPGPSEAKLNAGNFTSRIDRIIGFERSDNIALRHEYFKFCISLGISKPKNKKPNGFWNNPFNNDFPVLDHLLGDDIELPSTLSPQISIKEPNTTKTQVIEARIGQGKFREIQIKYWKGCSLTGCEKTELLRASHIKPWGVSNNRERLNLYNGLLLTPILDALFDKGYISFENNGRMLCSNRITREELNTLGCDFSCKIEFSKYHYEFLEYHRKNVFR